jgi:exonuclease III
LKKISAITSLESDIVLLCDLRLGTDDEHKNNLTKLFRYNKSKSYEFFYNSSKSSRGVGILISNSLNYKVTNIIKDASENILGITFLIDQVKLRIFSIYGPNSNDFNFFSDLNNYLSVEPDIAVVIGGDWNATYSINVGLDNIDIFRMQSPPSVTRSMWLNQICRDFSLCDPYRALHPTTRDYTFIPHGTRANRSRIDFFLVGDELITVLGKCDIGPCVGTTLFDHKPVLLDFKTEKKAVKCILIDL